MPLARSPPQVRSEVSENGPKTTGTTTHDGCLPCPAAVATCPCVKIAPPCPCAAGVRFKRVAAQRDPGFKTFADSQGGAATGAAAVDVSVITWNVLAEKLIKGTPTKGVDFKPKPENATQPGQRETLVAKKVLSFTQKTPAPIILLQEVQEDFFNGALKEPLEQSGYTAKFKRNKPFNIPFTGNMGLVVAWPNAAYELKDEQSPDYLAATDFKWETLVGKEHVISSKQGRELLLHNRMDGFIQQTPLFVRLETKEKIKDQKRKTFGIVTYHFPSDHTPGCEIVAGSYAVLVGKWLTQKVLRDHPNMPLVMAGDFNAQPNSMTYKYLTHPTEYRPTNEKEYQEGGSRSKEKADLMQKVMSAMNGGFEGFDDTFAEEGAKPALEWTGVFKLGNQPSGGSRIDYVFRSKNGWKNVHQRLACEVPETTDLPNTEFPSDHLPIQADLQFGKIKSPQQRENPKLKIQVLKAVKYPKIKKEGAGKKADSSSESDTTSFISMKPEKVGKIYAPRGWKKQTDLADYVAGKHS